jgi:hypothetical protein
MASQSVNLQRGNLVRLKSTGALFEVKEVKGDGRLIIAHGPSVLNVGAHAVSVVREFNSQRDEADDIGESISEIETAEDRAETGQS